MRCWFFCHHKCLSRLSCPLPRIFIPQRFILIYTHIDEETNYYPFVHKTIWKNVNEVMWNCTPSARLLFYFVSFFLIVMVYLLPLQFGSHEELFRVLKIWTEKFHFSMVKFLNHSTCSASQILLCVAIVASNRNWIRQHTK